MNRPPLPPESFSRRTPTFQFPKSLLRPLLRRVTAMKDRGWLPAVPLEQHVVICGFPRSGTTLFQLMLEGCVEELGCHGRERRALDLATCGRRGHSVLLSKRPKDLFLIPEIREFYAPRGVRVQFILLHRDPRGVLTSRHFSRPAEYYLSVEEWRHYFAHWNWHRHDADVLSISYEELVQNPERVEQRVLKFTGWQARWSFQDFVKHVPPGFDARALNTLRELDPSRLKAWGEEQHRERLVQLLRELPELPQCLIEMGLEPSDDWLRQLPWDVTSRLAA
ncbi:MAG: sulfotransferase family protein [Planctomycetaceae bacterium]